MGTNNVNDYSPTQYCPQVGGVNGKISSVALGASGTVLTSNGSSADPTFQVAPGSPGLTVVQTQVISGSVTSVSFTSIGSYTRYRIMVWNTVLGAGASGDFGIRLSRNNGLSYTSAGYNATNSYSTVSSTSFTTNNTSDMFSVQSGMASGTSLSGSIDLFGMNQTATDTLYCSQYLLYTGGGTLYKAQGWGNISQANLLGAADSFQFVAAGGISFSGGTFSLYGYN